MEGGRSKEKGQRLKVGGRPERKFLDFVSFQSEIQTQKLKIIKFRLHEVLSSVFRIPHSDFPLPNSVICHLSSVICLLSSVLCHLSSVLCHLSSVLSPLSSDICLVNVWIQRYNGP
ncbi:hypothetical protein D1AOALGA4SA_7158 [Olavius algarvensis Delta 1 endosymbiont]|nr:hypothetical protein D1AOALGA4SA_7158 [Olavius algarvensis Delta 1 endosymbiont]